MKKDNLMDILGLVFAIIVVILSIPLMEVLIILSFIKEVLLSIYDLFLLISKTNNVPNYKENKIIDNEFVKQEDNSNVLQNKSDLLKLKKDLLQKMKNSNIESYEVKENLTQEDLEEDLKRVLINEKESN